MILELTAEQEAFRSAVDRFAREHVAPRASEIDESGRYPRELVADAASQGLLGITISPEHGGLGRDHLSAALAVEAVARASATLAVILVVANNLVAEVVARFGRPTSNRAGFAGSSTGASIGVFALSEENAGTDAANQETIATAEVTAGGCPDAKSGSPTRKAADSGSCSRPPSPVRAGAASRRSSFRSIVPA